MHSQSSFESSPHPPVGNADAASKSLLEAQEKARALFERRHWRKRIAQALKNTMLTYYDQPPDRRIAARIGGFHEELLTVWAAPSSGPRPGGPRPRLQSGA